MSKPREWQEITDILTPEGVKKLKLRQVLVFDYEGSRNEYKVMEIKDGRVWVKPVTLLTVGEADDKLTDAGFDPNTTKIRLKEELE